MHGNNWISGLDARGFLLGPMVAVELNAAFVPVRKRGKLPGSCIEVGYAKEYGTVSVFSSLLCSELFLIGRICMYIGLL